MKNGRPHVVALVTGQLAALTDSEPEEFDLYPADSSGVNFVCRSYESEPWVTLSFGALDDGTPYLYTGGRITPRSSGGR